MSPAVILRGMLSARAAYSRRSTGKTRTRIRAFSNVPVPTPAQRGVHYVQNLANLAASISPLLVEDTYSATAP